MAMLIAARTAILTWTRWVIAGSRRGGVAVARSRRAPPATVPMPGVVLGGPLVAFAGDIVRPGGPGFDGIHGPQGAGFAIAEDPGGHRD